MRIVFRKKNSAPSGFSPASYAAEISRLETLIGAGVVSETFLANSGEEESPLQKEMGQGPLADLLKESEDNPALALLKAKAQLAAYNARLGVETGEGNPPWLRTLTIVLVIPLTIGILAPSIVSLIATQQQLKLFQEQKSIESTRKQADLLLSQMASLIVRARELKDSVDYFEVEGLSPGQADRLYRKAVELEHDFRSAVQFHNFDSFSDLRDAELLTYYELKSFQDCLYKEAGRDPSESWRSGLNDGDNLLRAVTSEKPCGDNFDTKAFESLTTTINNNIASRIGGALFPRQNANDN